MIQLIIEKKEKAKRRVRKNNPVIEIKSYFMPIVKVIEVIASSEKSFDDAVVQCVDEVSKTIHNIDSVYIKDFKVHVKNGKPVSYGIICKVSFRVDVAKK